MLNVTEETHTVLACDKCSHKEIEIYVNGRTSYTIEFLCGKCGRKNKFCHASSETPI